MIALKHSLVIEATSDPRFFGFYSPDLPGFSGTGTSLDDCVERARAGMEERLAMPVEQGMPVPAPSPEPRIVVHNQRGLANAAGF